MILQLFNGNDWHAALSKLNAHDDMEILAGRVSSMMPLTIAEPGDFRGIVAHLPTMYANLHDLDVLVGAVEDVAFHAHDAQRGMDTLDTVRARLNDERAAAILEPLRFGAALMPSFFIINGSASCDALMSAHAKAFRAFGYATWNGPIRTRFAPDAPTRDRCALVASSHLNPVDPTTTLLDSNETPTPALLLLRQVVSGL